MRLDCFRLLLLLTKVITSLSLQLLNQGKYHQLVSDVASCITASGQQFSSGMTFYSNPKSQMGTWIPNELMNRLLVSVNDTVVNEESIFIGFMAGSSIPLIASLTESHDYDLSLIAIPRSSSLPRRTHAAGTVLLYKIMQGEANLYTMQGGRVIQQMEMQCYGGDASEVMKRLGGPARVLSASNASSCLMLELAVHPPEPSNPGYSGGHGVRVPENASSILRISVPKIYSSDLFYSSQESVTRRMSGRSNATTAATPIATVSLYSNIQRRLSRHVGGAGVELDDLVRRITLSRGLSAAVATAMGLSHVKGVLLHGAPGTGKTLIARELAKALNASSVKIVNGPEIMDKFVGEAERNIRNLFVDAEEEWKIKGPDSGLHVVVFDEIDSIAKPRGSLIGDGSGVRDSCVNQLLSKIDGIQEFGNILVIGLTNRKDLIDPALLRSGRLEVHVEIKAPDQTGREEILAILMRPFVTAGAVDAIEAQRMIMFFASPTYTDSWTGADLAGFLRSAVSFALKRSIAVSGYALSGDGVYRLVKEDLFHAYLELSATINKRPSSGLVQNMRSISSVLSRLKARIRLPDKAYYRQMSRAYNAASHQEGKQQHVLDNMLSGD